MAWTTPKTWITGELATAAMLNTHIRDNLAEFQVDVPNTNWNVPTIGGGWTAGTGADTPRWKKIGNLVHVNGLVTHATGGTTGTAGSIFTLPAGARPAFELVIPLQGNYGSGVGGGLPWLDVRYDTAGRIFTHTANVVTFRFHHTFWAEA